MSKPHAFSRAALCLVLASGIAAARPLWQDMVPTPKQAKELGEAVPLPAGAVIVAPAKGKAHIGADEINQRLGELKAPPLRVVEPGDALPAAPLVIVVGGAAENPLAPGLIKQHAIALPAEPQGYVVRFIEAGGRPVVLLAGHDPQGTLYACVTFRHLLERGERGVTVSRADIADWPDFKFRGYASVLFYRGCRAASTRDPERVLAFMKQRLDWLLRHKINVTADYNYYKSDLRLPQEPLPLESAMNAYALERGILPCIYQSTCVGIEKDKEHPQFRNAALIGHSRLFTWSDDALLKRRAEVLARFVQANRFAILALHPPDGGGPVDPSQWSKRSAADKARWRDDQRAEADTHVFNIFYNAARRRVSDIKVAYTVYPYNAVYLDYDYLKASYPTLTREQCDRNGRLYWIEFEKLIPPDVHLVVWNSWPKYMDRFRAIFKARPVYYWCDFAGRWHRQPYFTAVHRYLGENFYNHPDDVVMASHDRIRPNLVNQLCSVEFAWNRNAPGAAPFNGRYWDMFKDATGPREIMQDFAARACRLIWGPEAGPKMAPLFQSNVNPALLVHTEHVLKYENRWRRRRGKPDVMLDATLIGEQVANIAKALPGLEAVVKGDILLFRTPTGPPTGQQSQGSAAQRKSRMSPFSYRCVVYYYRRVRVLSAVARLRYAITKASELLAADKDDEAGRIIAEGQKLWAAELAACQQMAAATEKLPHLHERFAQGRPPTKFSVLLRGDTDFDTYRRGLLQLSKQLGDKKVTLEQLKHEGPIRVAVYNAAADGGKSIGHEGLLATFKAMTGVEAEFITDLSIRNLARYDVVAYPQCFMGNSGTAYDFHTGLRRYVAEAGGGVWFQHDSIGGPRSQFGTRTAFAEVSRGTLGRVDSNQARIARKHAITEGFAVGHVFQHAYYDHWTVKRGRKGVVLATNPDSRPVWVVGQVGRGRVLYDGSIMLDNQNHPAAATDEHLTLMRQALEWLAARR